MSGLTYLVKLNCNIFYMFNRYGEARTETVGIGLIVGLSDKSGPVPKCPVSFTRWDEKAGLREMPYAPNVRRAQGTMKRRPVMKKTNTVLVNGNMIFNGHKLTIGVDPVLRPFLAHR